MPDPNTFEVLQELERMLASPVFANSPRMSRFLRFLVEQALEGKGGLIKEYVVAVEVFDKKRDYDPRADSTVRTEAGKLRSRIGRYYDTVGRDDPVVITIPKGSYLPAFEDRRNGDTATIPPRNGFPRIKVAVILGTVGVAVVIGVIWRSRLPRLPAPRLLPFTSFPEVERQPSISPDGAQVAFCGRATST